MSEAVHHKAPVMIAAGGTGGHLFPGQALAEELTRRGHNIVLITDERVQHFDRLFPGADIYAVPSATFSGGGLVGYFRSALKILSGTQQSFDILGRVKPSVIVGFGGYPTMPPMLAAIIRRVPCLVHEQNAVLGRVNKAVAPFITAIASTFPNPKYLKAKDRSKLVVTGNPVRDVVHAACGNDYVAPQNGAPINLLVFGGSQGARVMSDVVPGAIQKLPDVLRARLRVVQQCRPEDLERVRQVYETAGVEAELSDFFDDMPMRIADAQLVIGRAGASSVSELSVIGRPSILVPLPHSLDQDQKANAEVLSEVGAALMMEQGAFTPDLLAKDLEDLFGAPQRLAGMAAAALSQGKPDAVNRLADLVERVAAGGTPLLPSGDDRIPLEDRSGTRKGTDE